MVSISFGRVGGLICWESYMPLARMANGSPQFLEDYLETFGLDPFRDWFGSGQLTAVSADGRVVAGWGAGPTNFQGYVIALPD